MRRVPSAESGAEFHEAGLREVAVEGEGFPQSKPSHEGETGTVCEAKLLVLESLEEGPRLFNGIQCEILDPNQATRAEFLAKLDRGPVSRAKPDYGIAFIEDIIRGEQPHSRIQEPSLDGDGVVVQCVPAILDRQERSGIH